MRLDPHRGVVAAACALGLVSACARQGAPAGGPEDLRPPVVVSTYPAPFSTVEEVDGAVRFEFDERISERVTGGALNEAVSVSPKGGEITVKHGRTTLSVEMEGGFQRGVVYRVTLRAIVSDMFGNRLGDPFELIFSTGEALVPTTLAGEVWDRITGNPLGDALVYATGPDGLVHQSRTDRAGIFAFRYIPEGSFDVTAFEDVNRNAEVDSMEAQGAVLVDMATGDTVIVDLSVLEPDTAAAVAGSGDVLDSVTIYVDFDDFLDPSAPIEDIDLVLTRADSSAPTVLRAFHEADYAMYVDAMVDSFAVLDSIDDAAAAALRAQEAASAAALVDSAVAPADSAATDSPPTTDVPPTTDSVPPADVAPPQDTVVIDPVGDRPQAGTGRAAEGAAGEAGGDSAQVARGGEVAAQERGPPRRATPTPLDPLQGSRPGLSADGRRVLPARRIVLQLSGPLEYEVDYEVEVSGVVNINGMPGGGGVAPLFWELPPVDTTTVDSLGLDTLGVDTLGLDTLEAGSTPVADTGAATDGGAAIGTAVPRREASRR